MNNRTVPTATVVEESSNSEGLPVAPSVRLIGRTLVSSMDRSWTTVLRTELQRLPEESMVPL